MYQLQFIYIFFFYTGSTDHSIKKNRTYVRLYRVNTCSWSYYDQFISTLFQIKKSNQKLTDKIKCKLCNPTCFIEYPVSLGNVLHCENKMFHIDFNNASHPDAFVQPNSDPYPWSCKLMLWWCESSKLFFFFNYGQSKQDKSHAETVCTFSR